ncbi:MAG: tetratricopeptide repeat protein [Acidobacteria bacterium]|nr:tetratricopeptide repeat protein [Acidobacteriota bacterium]
MRFHGLILTALSALPALAGTGAEPARKGFSQTGPARLSNEAIRACTEEAILSYRDQRYQDAERAARRALDGDRDNLRARYVLGLALLSQNKYMTEAIDNLTRAAESYPEAHLELGRIYVERGDFPAAMKQLELFSRHHRKPAGISQLLAK